MSVGKSSIKRASGAKTAPAAEAKAAPAAKKAAPAKKAAAPKKAAPKQSVIAATDEQFFITIDQSAGINAHYGVNEPLPTFLL